MLYSGPAFVWAWRISAILLYVIYRALPGGSDRIVLYYCLMATWTGLGDNTELFWAVLSHLFPFFLELRRRASIPLCQRASPRSLSAGPPYLPPPATLLTFFGRDALLPLPSLVPTSFLDDDTRRPSTGADEPQSVGGRAQIGDGEPQSSDSRGHCCSTGLIC
jgi:hypothetical protein